MKKVKELFLRFFLLIYFVIVIIAIILFVRWRCNVNARLVTGQELNEIESVEEINTEQVKVDLNVQNERHVVADDYSFISGGEEKATREKMLEEFTKYDIDIMARVVMSESSVEPYECKVLVAKTLLNRYYSDNFKGSIYELADSGFSTQDNGEVTEECYEAVYEAFTRDDPVFYFRTDYYHSFGQPYKQVGITCFSTE